MNLERFIAKRVASSNKQSFSGLIIKIAIVAVALSLAVMIVATAVISGFKHQIGEKIFGFWGHIQITSPQINQTTGEAVPISINQNFYPSLDTIREVPYQKNYEILGHELPFEIEKKTKGGVRHIQVFTLKPGIIKTKNKIEGIILKGVGKDFNWAFFDKYLVEGKRLELPDSVAGKGILISQQTASRLQLSIGDKFRFNYLRDKDVLASRFVVQGIYKTGLEEYDRKFALVDIRETQRLLNWDPDEVGGFEVFIDDLSDLEILSDYIYYEEVPANLYCESIRSKYPAIFEWLALQDINEVVILVLMVIVGLINMITALMILILERTNMIGILKALGQTNWGIRKTFLYQAGYIILLGLFWGNIAGIGACLLQQHFGLVQLSEENYYLSVAPIEINYWSILLLNLGALAVIMAFLIIPSWLVTKIDPVKAIRFK
ncbi:MAG TPA: ABC transporter permease [Bacteroidetes bacterium]|nr:ABC transporter permease [Bacteroidota bacterium]